MSSFKLKEADLPDGAFLLQSQKPEETQKIRLRNVVYSVDMLTGEMMEISEQIRQTEETIVMLNSQILKESTNLVDLQSKLIVLYIQETKSFPPS